MAFPGSGVNTTVSPRLKVPVRRDAHTAVGPSASTTVNDVDTKPILMPGYREERLYLVGQFW